MCLTENTYWACHRCGQDISDPTEPPVMYCFRSLINQKCSHVVTNVIVVCDPALCLYCGFHRHEKYDEVEDRVRGMSVGQGFLGSQRMKFYWGVDPAMAWESFKQLEKKRLAYAPMALVTIA
ncbi:hypothetical protein BHE90_004659 [Fusarium euwallaceae]|uniref:Uncharacterized protein n=1 Tax=Fusarium euwallaceae TaxID=1147111 RepID=A0A430LYK2_9HYPO|nr:hypothetical protein BHE90_004659 [Fusarium euwallaceae]